VVSMNVWIDIDKDAEECAKRVLSNAWDGKEWCEDGSIRQDIIDLKSQMVDIDDSLYIINKKIDVLVKSIAEVDSLKVLKRKLTGLSIRWVDGSDGSSNAFDIK
jgi:hypothetical protein